MLESTIWYPASSAQKKFPLLVYSHGYMSTRDAASNFAMHLASHGFIVVAADFPLTSRRAAPDVPYVFDIINQPADVSFIIDALLALSADSQSVVYGMVDSDRIGAFGLSLGGLTSTLLAFHPQLADPRIGAAMSIAGPTSMFNERFFTHRDVPFLMLAGEIDALVPYAGNAAPVLAKVPGAELVTLRGGTHTGFDPVSKWLRWFDNPDWLGCALVKYNLTDYMENDWTPLFGDAQMGVNLGRRDALCETDPLPAAINPMRQMMVAVLVVEAFFSRQFGADNKKQLKANRYIGGEIASELSEVTYQRALQ